MENATKALLIAAAVLIAILIISLGIMVYQMAAETMGDVNLSEAEITQFNSKFQSYEGQNVSGSKVNAMIKTVFNHNLKQDDPGKKVTIEVGAGTSGIALGTSDTQLPTTMADTGKTYTVKATYSSSSGLITKIKVTVK